MDVFQQEHKCIVICGCERICEGSDSLNYYKRAGIEAIYRKNDRVLYNYHIHCNTVNIGIVLRGNLIWENEGDVKILSSEEAFCVMPFCSHKLTSDGVCSLLMISVSLDDFIKKRDNVLLHDIKDCLLCYDIFCSETLLLNITKVLSGICINSDYLREIERKKDYIKLLDVTKTLDEMAGLMNYSKYHFLRKFKSDIRITPHKLKQIRMIRKAQKMFSTGQVPNEVIKCLNYYDQSHFIKQFKHVVGITPSEYIAAVKSSN